MAEFSPIAVFESANFRVVRLEVATRDAAKRCTWFLEKAMKDRLGVKRWADVFAFDSMASAAEITVPYSSF
jgi:hypothetical protein